MSESIPSPLRPESVERLHALETSTSRLASQLEGLTRAIGNISELREQTLQTHTQAELAVLTSLDATNEVSEMGPTLTSLVKQSITWADVRRHLLRGIALALAATLIITYGVVSGQQWFSAKCQYPSNLSVNRADWCNMAFIGDRHYYPGPQYSNKLPGQPPASTTEGAR